MLTRTLAQMPAGASSSVPNPTTECFAARFGNENVDPKFAGRNAASGRGLGCVRGLRYAIIFEVAAALVLYALWRLWMLI